MERARVLVLGTDEAEHHVAEVLRGAGYATSVAARVPRDLRPALVVVVAGDVPALCRSARATYPGTYVLALVDDADGLAGTSLAAGADEVAPPDLSRTTLLSQVRGAILATELRARAEAGRRTVQLLDEVTTWLAADDLVEGLFEISTRLAEVLGFSRCAVLVLPEGDPLTIYIAAASDDAALSKFPLELAKYPEVKTAIDSREAVFVEDAASSPLLGAWAAAAAAHGGRSLLSLPLIGETRPIGALLLRSHAGHPPLDEETLRLANLAASVMSLSLRGHRLDSVREQTRRTSLVDLYAQRRSRALDQYRDFFESAADGMLVVDGQGEVLYVNRAAEDLTGYARSGLCGRSLLEIVAPTQRAWVGDVVAEAAAGELAAPFDLQLMTTSGEPLRVSVSTSRVLAEHGAVVLAFRDVTLARALEDELRKTKEFLERLIDSTVDAIVSADMRGRIILFNPGAERLFGYRADEVVGHLPVWRFYSDGVAREIMTRLRAPESGGVGRLAPTRQDIVTRDGTKVPVSLTASIIYEEGREIATVGILSDLRERLNIEQRLAQAQEKLLATEKQALIADLAGTTAHELNQPLTSIMGYAELMKKRMSPDDAQARAVDIILREAERMAQIVRKIGKITRYETKTYVGSTTILDLDKSATEG